MEFNGDNNSDGSDEPDESFSEEDENFFSEEVIDSDIDTDYASLEGGGEPAASASTEEESKGKLRTMLDEWRLYSEISELGLVARRFFVKNMTDGILTTLGVIIGFFVAFLADQTALEDNNIIILPGIGTAVAMCVSGILASYFVESAERKKAIMDLQREMVEVESEEDSLRKKKSKKKRKNRKTLQERAESFATIVASLIDGFSPFIAALVVLIPFYAPGVPQVFNFLFSIALSLVLLFLLGTYLARLSKVNWIVLGIKMVFMGVLTLVITYALGQL